VSRFVLDASALLAGFFREDGAEVVARDGAGGVLSAVNYTEVLVKLRDRRIALEEADQYLSRLNLIDVPFDRSQAVVAAGLRDRTRALGLSFGDRACLACACSRQLPVLTCDRRLAEAEVGVEVILIRKTA
jgi:PIN domain nuclease of toxin-antitoxin system